MADAIRIHGLEEFQRDIKRMAPDQRREIPKALRKSAVLVHRTGMPFVARRTGTLGAAWRVGANQRDGAFVRNRLPQAGVLEFGGTIRPRGTPFTVRAQPSMTRALEARQEDIVDLVADVLDVVARRNGWH